MLQLSYHVLPSTVEFIYKNAALDLYLNKLPELQFHDIQCSLIRIVVKELLTVF